MTEKEPATRIHGPKAGNDQGIIFSRVLVPESMPQHFRLVPLAIGFHYTKHDSLKWLRASPLNTQMQLTRGRNQLQEMTSIIFTFFSRRGFAPFYALIISACPGSSSCQPALSTHGGKVTFFFFWMLTLTKLFLLSHQLAKLLRSTLQGMVWLHCSEAAAAQCLCSTSHQEHSCLLWPSVSSWNSWCILDRKLRWLIRNIKLLLCEKMR